MPDPIFITSDDKRIRDLSLLDSLQLNDLLPMDRTGLPAALKYTPQMLLDLMSANMPIPGIYSGATNPDNAFGNNGDTYYKYVEGSTFSVWTKSSDVWDQLFEINLGGITFTGDTDASGNITATTGTSKLIAVYEGDVLVRPEYNKSTKVLSGLNPEVTITAYFA